MRRITQFTAAAAAAVALAFSAAPAGATATRTFVSGQGTDTGSCAVTAPCRSFAYAITQTSAGGEIVVLNSAGYGAVTISQAVSITNEEGVEAAVTVTSGDGITVSAGSSDVVNLTGITLTGGGGANGVTFNTGGTLNIQNCVARGFTNNGLNLVPTTTGAVANVTDSVVADNAGNGVDFAPSVTANAVFHRVVALGNANNNIIVDGTRAAVVETVAQAVRPVVAIQAIASDTIASGNGTATPTSTGYQVVGLPTNNTFFMVANSKASGGLNGVTAENAVMYLNGTTITAVTQLGYNILTGGIIYTYGNNANTAYDNQGTLSPLSPQ